MKNETSTSPLPTTKKEEITEVSHLDFPAAMKEIIDGKKITKLEWDNTNTYCVLHEGILKLYKENKFYQWIINDGDLIGKDWVVILNKNNG